MIDLLPDTKLEVFNYACGNLDYFLCQLSTKVWGVAENYILHRIDNFENRKGLH